MRRPYSLIGTAIGTLAVCTISFAAQPNPTMRQLDSAWRALYGPKPHQGIVVYNKMAGGTTAEGDVSLDTLCVLRLLGDGRVASVKQLFPYQQCPSPFGASYWGVTSGYAISKDGSRIAAQNCHGVMVCDSSGAHKKVISTADIGQDCIALSFDDTVTNGKTLHRVVYAGMPMVILRTALSDTNTAVKTDTLWKQTATDACFENAMPGLGYTSVNKSGKFLSFNLVVTSGACIPVVVDLSTKGYKLPLGNCYTDGCQIRSCWDAAGTVSFHVWSHRIPTALWSWNTPEGESAGSIPCLTDPEGCDFSKGDIGQGGYYWCETDTNFMIQTGDNDVIHSPGCYSKAYIRKGKRTTPPQVIYLGDYFGWPAIWIDPAEMGSPVKRELLKGAGIVAAPEISRAGSLIRIAQPVGIPLHNVCLLSVKGVTVAVGNRTGPVSATIDIRHIPAGVYFVAWRESAAVKSRMITVTR
jgi:hypothetical protein